MIPLLPNYIVERMMTPRNFPSQSHLTQSNLERCQRNSKVTRNPVLVASVQSPSSLKGSVAEDESFNSSVRFCFFTLFIVVVKVQAACSILSFGEQIVFRV